MASDSFRLLSVLLVLVLIIVLLLFRFVISLLEPLQERLGGPADLLRYLDFNVFLACLGSPGCNSLLTGELVFEVRHKDARDSIDELGVLGTDEALGSTEEGFLVTVRSDHLLEETAVLLDLALLDDITVEEGLSEDLEGAVLLFDAEFNSLLIDLDVVDRAVVLLLLRDNPLSENVVGGVLALILALNNEGLLEVVGEILSTRLDGLLGHVNRPVVILEDTVAAVMRRKFLRLSPDALGEFVVGTTVDAHVLRILGARVLRGAFTLLALLSFAGRLALLLPLGRVLDNVAGQFVAEINIGTLTTCLAVAGDMAVLADDQVGLGVLALAAKNELVYEAVKGVLKLGGVVVSVDDVTVVRRVGGDLSAQLETEKLDNIWERC